MPLSKVAFGGVAPIFFLARTFLLVNEPDSAVTQLRRLLSMPSNFTPAQLRIDPTWAPLRSNARFKPW